MTITRATDEDFAFGQKVHHLAYREMVLRQFGEWDETVQGGFFERTWNGIPHGIVRDENGEKCGYCAVERTAEAIFLREIALLPEWQGRGIGGAIIRDLIAEGDEKAVPVRLNVMKSNTGARRLYERLGFRRIGETETHFQLERIPTVFSAG
ncbi:MAG: GNAT family N-acetyltransferase [Verrucomicrobiae bacterium]|nr:GNAT family N-acetyltransferase [Verrucomicrobiae bacterium]MCP5539917.1 GNAT family N-acetyltransferase [Akkermansiaceae bacterium]